MRLKIKRWPILILLLLVLTSTLAGCRVESRKQLESNPNTWQVVKRQKKIVIGLDDTFVPFGFETKQGKIVGYDVDLAKAVFKQYGIKVDFQPIDWSMNVTELRNGTIDLIWNGFSITPQRAQQVLFSEPYIANEQIMVTKKKSNINKIKDLTGKEVGVQGGSAGAMDISNQPKLLKNFIKNKEPVLYDSFTDAFIDLNANRIQGLLIDSTYANYYIAHQANRSSYKVLASQFPDEQYGVGMRKGDYLLKSKIDKGLNNLAKDGQLQKINKKWFGTKIKSPILDKYK